jgi:SAM-dependent methyltransferase
MTRSNHVVSISGTRFSFEFEPAHDVYFGNDNKTAALQEFILARLATCLPRALSNCPVTGSFTVRLTPYNPVIDVETIVAAAAYATRHARRTVSCAGGIKGTAPLEVRNDDVRLSDAEPTSVMTSDAMRRYRTCFDVRRQKRLKIFLNSMMANDIFRCESIEDIARHLSSPEGTALVLAYGEDVKLVRQTACPLCGSANIHFVHPDVGWPRVGFLTCHSQYYSRCASCTHVFLNPSYEDRDCYKFYDDADSEISIANKRGSTGVEQSSYYLNFCDAADLLEKTFRDDDSLHFVDIGAGECTFGRILRRRFDRARISACDFKKPEDDTEIRQSRISFMGGDFFKSLEAYEDESIAAITAFELIEHLTTGSFQKLITLAHRKLRRDGVFILSTPDKSSRELDFTDFWLAYAPQHLSVFNREILQQQFEGRGFVLQATMWRSYAFTNNDIELSFYRDAYRGICDAISSHLEFMAERNDARLRNGERCLSGDSHGCEIIMSFRKSPA